MQPDIIFIDSFCGAGGVSEGARMSGVARVVAAINHDPIAIKSHTFNHPHTCHFIEDIRTCPLGDLVDIVSDARRKYPKALVMFWASLECTQFSKAKGGKSRLADSRMLAWALPRYIQALQPDLVGIENVEEFMGWGDLDERGRPICRRNGFEYMRWIKGICAMGYTHDWRILNAADFGAYTSRERYFGVFHRPHIRHAWPQPTHASRRQKGSMFPDARSPWKPVSDVLDFSDLGRSLFDRSKTIVDKTIVRVLKGLTKFIDQPLLMTCNTPGYCSPLNRPSGTITTRGHKALVTPILQTYYNNGGSTPMSQPAPTITTKDRICLVSAFIVNPQYRNNGRSIMSPAPTVIASQKSNPLGLAVATYGPEKWTDQPSDSATMRELKAFMRANGIADIYLRMLKVDELKRIQGFPADYVLLGTQEQQKKFIGNAVVPAIVSAWMKAIAHVHNQPHYTCTSTPHSSATSAAMPKPAPSKVAG